jgi:NAD+ synthase (glutamine-hydrolysing)
MNKELKILGVQHNYIIGDLDGNTKKIIDVILNTGNDYDLIVFPELAITGYPPLDMVDRKGFVDAQLKKLDEIIELTKNKNYVVMLGFIDKNMSNIGKPLYNAMAVIEQGELRYKYYKQLLPTYNIFDESRHFEPGSNTGMYIVKGVKVGLLICEDAWNTDRKLYDIDPVAKLKQLNPELVVSINASPYNDNKITSRYDIIHKASNDLKAPFIYINQVGANDDIVFDGTSFMISPNKENEFASLSFVEQKLDISFVGNGLMGKVYMTKYPGYNFSMRCITNEENSYQFKYEQIVLGIKDYVTKCGFKGVVIGESGGIDSALVTALAVDALGAENVIAITMPSDFSSEGSWKDSEVLCKNLDVKMFNHPIKEIYQQYVSEFVKHVNNNEQPKRIVLENIQARIRGNILMEYSNNTGFLVLSTSNKSESSVGYTTLYGDMSGGLAPISDLYKTEVWELAKYYNTKWHKESTTKRIPECIIEKRPSAELAEGQKDTDSLPPYPILDAFLRLYIEGDLLSDEEKQAYKKTCDTYLAPTEIMRLCKLVDNSEFKRRQAPPTIRVHKRAWGAGRRLPIVQKYIPYNSI